MSVNGRQHFARLVLELRRRPYVVAVCAVVLFVFLVLRSHSLGESKSGVSLPSSADGSESHWMKLAHELKRDRRRDLKKILAFRRAAAQQLSDEVHELEELVDDRKDTDRVKALFSSQKPVDLAKYVVVPPIVHLTWKSKTRLPSYGSRNLKRWADMNPGYTVTLYDDDDVDAFVSKQFPEFREFWPSLRPVQKADVFRYLVMHVHGGVYSDLDVEPMRPVNEWMLKGMGGTLHVQNANVILGWEKITESEDWAKFYASQMQLCQWTFASSPGHPVWRAVLDRILEYYRAGNHTKSTSVIRSTGPGIFSDAVKDFIQKRYGVRLGEDPVSLKECRMKNLHIGDMYILKQVAFAEEGTGWDSADVPLVKHGFAGTWKESADSRKPASDKLDTEAGVMQRAMAKMREEFEKEKSELQRLNTRLKSALGEDAVKKIEKQNERAAPRMLGELHQMRKRLKLGGRNSREIGERRAQFRREIQDANRANRYTDRRGEVEEKETSSETTTLETTLETLPPESTTESPKSRFALPIRLKGSKKKKKRSKAWNLGRHAARGWGDHREAKKQEESSESDAAYAKLMKKVKKAPTLVESTVTETTTEQPTLTTASVAVARRGREQVGEQFTTTTKSTIDEQTIQSFRRRIA